MQRRIARQVPQTGGIVVPVRPGVPVRIRIERRGRENGRRQVGGQAGRHRPIPPRIVRESLAPNRVGLRLAPDRDAAGGDSLAIPIGVVHNQNASVASPASLIGYRENGDRNQKRTVIDFKRIRS